MKQERAMTYRGYHLNVMLNEETGEYAGDVSERQLPRLVADSRRNLKLEFASVIDQLAAEEIDDGQLDPLDVAAAGMVQPLGGSPADFGTPEINDYSPDTNDPGKPHEPRKVRPWED